MKSTSVPSTLTCFIPWAGTSSRRHARFHALAGAAAGVAAAAGAGATSILFAPGLPGS